MNEFLNRMDAQRNVLILINNSKFRKEELCGLSAKAIERWTIVNGISIDANITKLLKDVSKKLFFLACKSQEQVSESYFMISADVKELTSKLEVELANATN